VSNVDRGSVYVLPASAPALERISNAVAIALGDRDVRRFVISKLSASPWIEHKVYLADVLGFPNIFTQRVADVAGLRLEELIARVGSLPQMDFYLVDAQQRREWGVNGNPVAVVASSDGHTFMEYNSRGEPTRYVQSQVSRPVLAIHPAEVRMYRVSRSEPSSNVISGPGDEDAGLLIRYTDDNGVDVTIDTGKEGLRSNADLQAYARAHNLPGLAEPAAPAHGIALPGANTMTAHFFLDSGQIQFFPDGIGQSEVLIKMWKDSGPGNGDCCRVEWHWGSIEPLDQIIGNPCITDEFHEAYYTGCWEGPVTVFNGWYPGTGGYSHFRAQLFEEDTGPDDVFGVNYWGTGYLGNGAQGIWSDVSRCYSGGVWICLALTAGWTTF
jgi:hypothetical protein